MNEKQTIVAQMKAFIENGVKADRDTLLCWVSVLERDEQQTPPVAIGEPRAGESSVQPTAILQKFRDAIEQHVDQIEALSISNEFERGYSAGYTNGAFDAEETLQEILQVKHEAEHVAAG